MSGSETMGGGVRPQDDQEPAPSDVAAPSRASGPEASFCGTAQVAPPKPPHESARRMCNQVADLIHDQATPAQVLAAFADWITSLPIHQRLYADDWINDYIHGRVWDPSWAKITEEEVR